jgi:hypothetical protein
MDYSVLIGILGVMLGIWIWVERKYKKDLE